MSLATSDDFCSDGDQHENEMVSRIYGGKKYFPNIETLHRRRTNVTRNKLVFRQEGRTRLENNTVQWVV